MEVLAWLQEKLSRGVAFHLSAFISFRPNLGTRDGLLCLGIHYLSFELRGLVARKGQWSNDAAGET